MVDLPNFPWLVGYELVTVPFGGFKHEKLGKHTTSTLPERCFWGELPIHLAWRKTTTERKFIYTHEVEFPTESLDEFSFPQKTNMTGWKIHPKNEDSDVFLYFLLKNCVFFSNFIFVFRSRFPELGIFRISKKSGVQEVDLFFQPKPFFRGELFFNFGGLLPGKLTCPLKINGWKMYSLLK